MKKHLYHYTGVIRQRRGEDMPIPIAFDDNGQPVQYEFWRYASNQEEFKRSICRALNKRYHKDFIPYEILLKPENLVITVK